MDELTAFLRARYDEAEALARAAERENQGASWELWPDDGYEEFPAKVGVTGTRYWVVACEPTDGAYIADVDPAHRLVDIALKRAILAEHPHSRVDYNWSGRTDLDGPFGCTTCHIGVSGDVYEGGWCATVRHLGSECGSHADYKQAWKP